MRAAWRNLGPPPITASLASVLGVRLILYFSSRYAEASLRRRLVFSMVMHINNKIFRVKLSKFGK